MTAKPATPASLGEISVTRADVAGALRDSDWQAAGARLGISPGLAFMIYTGVPADGSGTPAVARLERPLRLTSSQQLVNPTQPNPLENEQVMAWIADRAGRELTT